MSKENMENPTTPIPNEVESDIRVTLELEDDTTVECEILTIFEADDRNYIVLLPSDENDSEEDEGEVFIYRYFEDEDGNPVLENIDTDEEYELVTERFDELLDEAAYEEM